MAITRGTFLGLSIIDFKSSIGWGPNQLSQLTVHLVVDPLNGDSPAPAALGTPIYFQYGAAKFFGLLQKFSKHQGSDGETYEAVATDPRELLDGVQLILGGYYGSTALTPNLVNVFGWWENNHGFGSSLANDSGMPWYKIVGALANIINQPTYTVYGGPITFRGIAYSLDLSELPVPPTYYRVGANSISLLELIAQLCDDGGHDFFVELIGYTIKVRTINRRQQPPLGTIGTLLTTYTNQGIACRAEVGTEIRNEITSSFLVGGEVASLHLTDAYASFWGFDLDGYPITGVAATLTLFNDRTPATVTNVNPALPNILATISTEIMLLNAEPVADIIGDLRYACTTFEMRCALSNYETWSAFVKHHRSGPNDVGGLIESPFEKQGAAGVLMLIKPQMVNDNPSWAAAYDIQTNSLRIYEFVKAYASEYYGKKFLVRLPFVLLAVDPQTLKINFSQEPTDGGWLPEGSAPLGLSALNEDVFKANDGRFGPFVQYGLSVALQPWDGKNHLGVFVDGVFKPIDLSRVSPTDSLIEGFNLYLRANHEQRTLSTLTGLPACVVTLGSALYEEAVDIWGGINNAAAVCLLTPDEGAFNFKGCTGNVPIKVWPAAVYPDSFAVPLKSNILTYGPWYSIGEPGKVKFEQNNSLVPWNFGGFSEMNLAGGAIVANALTSMQVSEAGSIEIVGAPLISLGDTLTLGGPNLTGMDISFGKDGVTTNYRFQTYTPRFGVFNKNIAERIKRQGMIAQEMRRNIRLAANKLISNAGVVDNAVKGFIANAPKIQKKESPYDVIVGRYYEDGDDVRVHPTISPYEESVGLLRADIDEDFQATAAMSLGGLLRPFTTQVGGDALLPGLNDATIASPGAITSAKYNPFQNGNDIEILAWNDSYVGMHAFRRGADEADTRAFALRGPLMLCGWGYDIFGRQVPADEDDLYIDNYLRRADQWPVGPVDHLYDPTRNVWTSHDIILGYVSGVLPAGGSFETALWDDTGDTGEEITVHNFFSSSVSGKIMAGYVAHANKWYVMAADCG